MAVRTSDAGCVGHARHRHGRRRRPGAKGRAGRRCAATGSTASGRGGRARARGGGRGEHAAAAVTRGVCGGDAASDDGAPIVHRLAQIRVGGVVAPIATTYDTPRTPLCREVVNLVVVAVVDELQEDGHAAAAMSTETDGLREK